MGSIHRIIMTDFIPIYKWAKLNNTSKQNVYRWIREHKIPPEAIKKVVKQVERINIKSDFKYDKITKI